MTTLSIKELKQEVLFFLRNSNVISIADRGVTTEIQTGTLTAATEVIIQRFNVKNIRSIVVGANTLVYGQDYQVNLDFDNLGTIECQITFTNAQTGEYTINYDEGNTDKIFPYFSQTLIHIEDLPRISVGLIEVPNEIIDFDGTYLNNPQLTIVIDDLDLENIDELISSIRSLIKTNERNFFYLGKFVKSVAIRAAIKTPTEIGKDKVWRRTLDIEGILNFER